MMWFRLFVIVCLLLLSYPQLTLGAFPSRYALFWLTGATYLNSSDDYQKAFHQWAAQNRSGYIMAADTYHLGADGSLQYYDGGENAEKYAFSTLSKMGLSTQAIFYTISVQGIAIMVANPKPIIDELISRALKFDIGGYHLYYELGEPLKHHNHHLNLHQLATSYADFMVIFGNALAQHNLSLTIGFMGCPSWNNLTCQSLSNMNYLLGAQTWDTLGVNDIPSYLEFSQAGNDAGLLGSKYCPGFFADYFSSSGWLQINQYLLQQNYTAIATYAANYANQADQPQWFFDGVNAFLDG